MEETRMRKIVSASVAIMVTGWLTAFGVPCYAIPLPLESQDQAGQEPVVGKEFQAMMAKVDTAQLELQNGRVEAFKALWSHADDVTLSGGFGGAIEKGWRNVSKRLDWVGGQFSKGTNTIERIVVNANSDLAYVVQIEHIRFHVPGQAKESARDYRVTMVFRRESEGWRIVHRHADSQMMKQAPK